MQLEIKIDLSDIYTEYDSEGSLTDIIKDEIEKKVRSGVWNIVKENMTQSFTQQIQRKIEADKDLKVKEFIEEIFTSKAVKKDSSGIPITIETFIENSLASTYINNESAFNNNVSKIIEKKTLEITTELRNRYDMLFASKIVMKMNEQGLLKDGVVNCLLENKNG